MLEHFASKLRKILNVVFESLYFLEHSCLKQAIYSPGIVFIEIPLVIYPWYVWDSKKRNGVYFRISGMNMKTIFKRVDRIEKRPKDC